jgi:hypothetical protein
MGKIPAGYEKLCEEDSVEYLLKKLSKNTYEVYFEQNKIALRDFCKDFMINCDF